MSLALLGLAELVGLWLLSAGVGGRLLRLFRSSLSASFERLLLETVLGLGALQFVPFFLFAFRVGTPGVIRGTMLLLFVVLAPDIRDAVKVAKQGFSVILKVTGWRRVFVIALSTLLALILLRAISPVSDGDALDYHLTLPLRLLEAGRWVYIPTITPTNWPSSLEMLYALLLSVHPESPIGVIPFLFGVLTLAAMLLYGRKLGGAWIGIFAVSLLWIYDGSSSVGFWNQMGTGMIDTGTTLFTTLAIFALHRSTLAHKSAQEKESSEGNGEPISIAFRLLAFVFAGLAATTKLTGVWVIVALTMADFIGKDLYPFSATFRRILSGAGIAVAVVSAWFVKTFLLTGNPIYPAFHKLFGGIEWTAEGWTRYQRAHMIRNTPPNSLPTPEILFKVHMVIGLTGLAICLFALWRTRRSPVRVPVAVVGVFTFCICIANYFLPRFFMPIIPTVMLCLAYTLRKSEKRLLIPATLVFCFLGFGYTQKNRSDLLASARVNTGFISRADYLRPLVNDYEMTQYVNAHFPPETVILIGDYDHDIALYHAQALWPDFWLQDAIHYTPQSLLEADLRRVGVTLLVLKTEFPDWCAKSHYCRERMETETPALIALARRRGKALYTANGFVLYRLTW